jgi:hypothetical protein
MMDSIKKQSVLEEINLVIGYDNDEVLKYIGDLKAIKLEYTGDKQANPFFYNTYMNELINCQAILPGHCLFLDDDDTLQPDAIKVLSEKLKPATSYIFPVQRLNIQKPTPNMIHAKRIHRGYIGMSCLVLATEHRQHVYFDETEDSDYRAICMLDKKVKLGWCNFPLVKSDSRSYGRMEK